MVWKDCFGRELKNGEDVIIAINDAWNEPRLYSGIILEMNDAQCFVTYNSWDGEEETVYDTTICDFQYEDGIVKCIYKIR